MRPAAVVGDIDGGPPDRGRELERVRRRVDDVILGVDREARREGPAAVPHLHGRAVREPMRGQGEGVRRIVRGKGTDRGRKQERGVRATRIDAGRDKPVIEVQDLLRAVVAFDQQRMFVGAPAGVDRFGDAPDPQDRELPVPRRAHEFLRSRMGMEIVQRKNGRPPGDLHSAELGGSAVFLPRVMLEGEGFQRHEIDVPHAGRAARGVQAALPARDVQGLESPHLRES